MARDSGRRPAGIWAVTLLSGLLVGCGAPVATPRPSLPATASPGDWTLANVERPADNIASTPPASSHDPNSAGHPGHPAGQAVLDAVAAAPGGLVAGGYVMSAGVRRATIWRSATGDDWTIVRGLSAADDSLTASLSGDAQRVIAVGSIEQLPAAWVSSDGQAWRSMPFDGPMTTGRATRATAVAIGAAAVAAGWVGGSSDVPEARFWLSRDDVSWSAARTDDPPANARIVAIAAGPKGYVAVGQTGPEGRPTGATAWFSGDGLAWSRVPDRDLPPDAVLEAVTSTEQGFVAVGSTVARDRAVVWQSADGRAWTAVPDGPVFHNFGLTVRMLGVARRGGGAVAVGVSLFGTQFGSATVWRSADGRTWDRVPDSPVFDGGEMAATTEAAGTLVAAGTWGAPDQFVPRIWLAPRP
jgi:hypothetical protein